MKKHEQIKAKDVNPSRQYAQDVVEQVPASAAVRPSPRIEHVHERAEEQGWVFSLDTGLLNLSLVVCSWQLLTRQPCSLPPKICRPLYLSIWNLNSSHTTDFILTSANFTLAHPVWFSTIPIDFHWISKVLATAEAKQQIAEADFCAAAVKSIKEWPWIYFAKSTMLANDGTRMPQFCSRRCSIFAEQWPRWACGTLQVAHEPLVSLRPVERSIRMALGHSVSACLILLHVLYCYWLLTQKHFWRFLAETMRT